MADLTGKTISELPTASTLTGAELFPISQSGASKKDTVQSICDFAQATVFEYGSNSDGQYVKFVDGTLICWKTKSFTGVAITSAWGNVYENTNALNLGNWATPFISTPTIFTSPGRISGSVSAFVEQIQNSSATAVGTTFFWCPRTHSSATVVANILGIGRWK